eukprot:snap_masked-scaffold_7-processed-gene-0.33-mRNA-1 protein AED:1.00 eAED:1.00 QI:0/0/0/0/1/1/2/0/637
MERNILKKISKGLKAKRLLVNSEGVKYLLEILKDEENIDESLNMILNELKKTKVRDENSPENSQGRTSSAGIEDIENILNQLLQETCQVEAEQNKNSPRLSEKLQIINSFNLRPFWYMYNSSKKRMEYFDFPEERNSWTQREFSSRHSFLRQRYEILRHRIESHAAFNSSNTFDSSVYYPFYIGASIKLTPISSLIGSSKESPEHVMFGLLVKHEDDSYYLEDSETSIELKLNFSIEEEKKTSSTDVYICEGCFVIVQGICIKNLFQVDSIGFPPAQARIETLRLHHNFFQSQNQVLLQEENPDTKQESYFMVITEVRIDTLFGKLMQQIENSARQGKSLPDMVVFAGNFLCSVPEDVLQALKSSTNPKRVLKNYLPSNSIGNRENFRRTFTDLAHKLIQLDETLGYRLFEKCSFCFVPGNLDPTATAQVLPNGPLLASFVDAFQAEINLHLKRVFQKKSNKMDFTKQSTLDTAFGSTPVDFSLIDTQDAVVPRNEPRLIKPKIHFASNPCRFNFSGKEVIVFNKNLYQEMSESSINNPQHDTIGRIIARTLIEQAHLFPLINGTGASTTLTMAQKDSSLRLTPLPDIVVCADPGIRFGEKVEDCTIVGTGSFIQDRCVTKIYPNRDKTVEFLQVCE